MDICALGEACNRFCDLPDERARSRDPFGEWLSRYQRHGMYDLQLYVRRAEGGYMSHGLASAVNWIPGDGVYHGYPQERPGGALNYRYDVPMDAYLPGTSYQAQRAGLVAADPADSGALVAPASASEPDISRR